MHYLLQQAKTGIRPLSMSYGMCCTGYDKAEVQYLMPADIEGL